MRIKQKIIEIEESLDLINQNLPPSLKKFEQLGIIKDGIYKRVEFIIQNIIDCLSIIYSKKKIAVPNSTDDIINGLESKKIFKKKTINKVRNMKGLRNIIAHRYGKINDSVVYSLLKENSDDILEIIEEIETIYNKMK